METAAALILIALIIFAFWIFKKRYPGKREGKKVHDLENDLLRLVSGRQDVADRLVRHEQARNPDKSRSWHLEKVIEQLKRDRR